MTAADPPRPVALGLGVAILVTATAVSVGAVGVLVLEALGGTMAHWVLGRAAGLTSYVLLLTLVGSGLVLAHPWARHLQRPTPRTRLTLHVALATFTLVFTALHVVVLATDPWAGVGWPGALLPMASTYRIAARVWWPVHKVASGVLALVWAHSVLAGSDVAALRGFYVATGCGLIGLAITRYAARTPADRVHELTRGLDSDLRTPERARR